MKRILREGDAELGEQKASLPNSFLLDVTFTPSDPELGDQVEEFLKKAGHEFDLTADGERSVPAAVYRGNRFATPSGAIWGFRLGVADGHATSLKPGASYRLVPRKPDPSYRWMINDDVTIVIPDTGAPR